MQIPRQAVPLQVPVEVSRQVCDKMPKHVPKQIPEQKCDKGDFEECAPHNASSPLCAAASRRYVWSSKNEMSGKYRFGCRELSGDACGDFGIVLTVTDGTSGETVDSVDVCREGAVHEGELRPGHSLAVGVWHAPEALFEAKCYAWVTKDGKLPAGSSSAHTGRAPAGTGKSSFS